MSMYVTGRRPQRRRRDDGDARPRAGRDRPGELQGLQPAAAAPATSAASTSTRSTAASGRPTSSPTPRPRPTGARPSPTSRSAARCRPPTWPSRSAGRPRSTAGARNATYTITITNNGPNAAQGVVLTDTLPAGVDVRVDDADRRAPTPSLSRSRAAASPRPRPPNIASGQLRHLQPGGLGPRPTWPTGPAFNDTASVQASNPDPNTANNTASTVTGSVVNNNTNADLSSASPGRPRPTRATPSPTPSR